MLPASLALVAKGPAVIPMLIERLAESPYHKSPAPDPVLGVLQDFGPRAVDSLPTVLDYLGKCDKKHIATVMELVKRLTPYAPKAVRKRVTKLSALNSAPPPEIKAAEWQVLCFELRETAAVEMNGPVADLIRTVKANRVFARELAAIALAKRGADAVAAVPALLQGMKTPKSLGKGAKDLKIDGKAFILRDQFFARCQDALVAIAPRDSRIYPVYSDRLRNHSDLNVRVAAADKLGEFGSKAGRAVSSMLKLVSDKTEERLLLAVVGALAKMGRPAKKAEYHIGRLTRSSKTSDAVKAAAREALAALK
jgi:hypothetical protein